MSNPMVKLAVSAISGLGTRQSRTYSIERGVFDPANAAHVQKYGFSFLGDALAMPSRGLHQIPLAQLQELSLFLINQATDVALYVDNTASHSLYQQGHVYEYRSPTIPVSAKTVAFVKATPSNSMRLLLHAFPNGVLELPAGTVVRMREQLNGGARDGALFRELRGDATVKAYQQAQWDSQVPVPGDIMLGRNSIIVTTRHERFLLDNDRYVVDIINNATREFHILDGSVLWIRLLDTTAHRLIFAVIGSGKHRHALMDAVNSWGAMTIWHYLALVQQCLYEDVPSTYAEIPGHLARARQQSDPVVQKLYPTLSGADADRPGAFLRGLRKGHAWENGDGYLSS